MRAAGYDTAEKVIAADPEQLEQLPGFDQDTVEAVQAAARQQVADDAGACRGG